jgi:nucleotide-binding universal stress UspA family protein
MKNIKKILFPVDLLEPIKKVIPYAQLMVDRFGADMHLLYVVRGLEFFTGTYFPMPPNMDFEEITSIAQKQMYDFRDEHFKDFPNTRATVLTGHAAEKILGYIKSEQIELVIMGTHGRKGLNKAIFGSVAERVVKAATVPVMVVNTFQEK